MTESESRKSPHLSPQENVQFQLDKSLNTAQYKAASTLLNNGLNNMEEISKDKNKSIEHSSLFESLPSVEYRKLEEEFDKLAEEDITKYKITNHLNKESKEIKDLQDLQFLPNSALVSTNADLEQNGGGFEKVHNEKISELVSASSSGEVCPAKKNCNASKGCGYEGKIKNC